MKKASWSKSLASTKCEEIIVGGGSGEEDRDVGKIAMIP